MLVYIREISFQFLLKVSFIVHIVAVSFVWYTQIVEHNLINPNCDYLYNSWWLITVSAADSNPRHLRTLLSMVLYIEIHSFTNCLFVIIRCVYPIHQRKFNCLIILDIYPSILDKCWSCCCLKYASTGFLFLVCQTLCLYNCLSVCLPICLSICLSA